MVSHTHENGHNLLPAADLEGEIERLHENLLDERDRHLRTLADFTNFRRRIERDGNTLAKEGKREMILPLLDVLDDLENVLQWATNVDQSTVQSIEIIYQKLLALLETQGVCPFDSMNELFNPDRHEAVAVAEHNQINSGTIINVLHRGYLWNDELLRPAQVRVAR